MVEQTPPQEVLSRETRKWAMLCHLTALVGLIGNGIGFLLGPLIVWLLKKEDHPFIDEQGKEAINFQITMFILALVALLLMLVVIGAVLLVLVVIIMTIFPIIAAVKANEGEHYRYPFCIRFIK